MLGRIRSRLTFANVCALLALVIALSTGTAYAADTVFSEDIVDGEVKGPDIHNNAVTSSKVAADSLGAVDLAAGSVASSEVADESLTAADLALNSVGSNEIATDAVQATEIADGSIDGGEIVDGSLGAVELAPGSVGTSEIIDSTIVSADVANNSLTTADIAGTDAHGIISLASGAVASGRCTNFNISVGGALAGQGVVLTLLDAVPSGVLITASRVPSDGNVTMPVCNFTGATFPALTDIDIRVITFG
jgi:hypothetical protein